MIRTQAPFEYYTDKNGDPLDGGYLYFGQPNQNPETSPIQVYWDLQGTIPAAQPIRTLNGYPVRNGTPANVFASGRYSVTVRNRKRELVFYARDSLEFTDGVSIEAYGAVGDGVTDSSAPIQAALDANKGRTITVPSGRFVHAGILLDGPTYNGTTIVCEGELVLRQRPTSGTNNFGGAWVGLILKDCSDVTVIYRGDGNRAAQPAEEHCYLVAIAGASRLRFPTFNAREVRGDGVYIGQSNFLANSPNPSDISFGEFVVMNSADDGRNAMTVVAVDRLSIGHFTSIRVGGLIGASTMPGGFDCEPNQDYQTSSDISIGSALVDTAGNFGFQFTGKNQGVQGGNIAGISVGAVLVRSRCLLNSVSPIAIQHCNNVFFGSAIAKFINAAQPSHAGLLIDNVTSAKINAKTVGGSFGARVGYNFHVEDLTLDIDARNYNVAGVQTVDIARSKVSAQCGGTGGVNTYGLYVRSAGRVGIVQTLVDYTIHCPQSGTAGATVGCLNESTDLVSFSRVRFVGGSLVGYTTVHDAIRTFGVGVQKVDVQGVNDLASIPTVGVWDIGNIVYSTAPAPSGFIGWVCTAAGTPGTWKTFGAISA